MEPPTRQDIEAAIDQVGGVVEKAADVLGLTLQAFVESASAFGLRIGFQRTVEAAIDSDGVATRATFGAGISMTKRTEIRAWSDCRSEIDRQRALAMAMAVTSGNVSRAAELLGVSRRHLSRYLNDPRHVGETPCLGETPETSNAGETPTDCVSLTYGRPAPSFRDVSSTPTMTTGDVRTEPKVNIESFIDRSTAGWLEMESVRRKVETGASRASKSVIVQEALEFYRKHLEGER